MTDTPSPAAPSRTDSERPRLGLPSIELAFCKLVNGTPRVKLSVDDLLGFFDKAQELTGGDWEKSRAWLREALMGIRTRAI